MEENRKLAREKLDTGDFYRMNPKFRKWLLKEKDIYFEDLSSEESKRYFQKFVKKWNRNELKEKYYTGENDTAATMKKTTRYTWDFAKKLDDRTLESVVKKVSEITNETRRSDPVPLSVSSNNIKVNGDSSGDKKEKIRKVLSRKRFEANFEATLDEIAPKETGRHCFGYKGWKEGERFCAAVIAKKRALNQYYKQEKDLDIDFTDAELMGSSDFYTQLHEQNAKKNERRARGVQVKGLDSENKQRYQEYRKKENDIVEKFRQLAQKHHPQ